MAGQGHPIDINDIDLDFIFSRCSPEPNSGCWLWLGAVSTNGYARIGAGGKIRCVSRLVAAIAHGKGDGLNACHRCDNPLCVNPDHLFWGNDADNMADKVRKGRQSRAYGTRCGMARLTEADAAAILLDTMSTGPELSSVYGVSVSVINSIWTRRTWRHVLPAHPGQSRGRGWRKSVLDTALAQAGAPLNSEAA